MNTNYDIPFTPATISNQNRVLNIPIYQRLFVWGEEQISLLLHDLWDAALKHPQEPYYIGIMTVVESKGGWDVVDGQQRLTFLSLFGAFARSKGFSIWNQFLYQDKSKQDKESLRINYVGRPEDRNYLQAIATADKTFSEEKNSNFRKFLECIEKYSAKDDFESFVNYVYNRTSFLISELPNNYLPQDLNSFFEKMNSTGRQLTPVEQIKGKYFPAHAAEFDACLNFEVQYTTPSKGDIEHIVPQKSIIGILESAIDIVEEKNDEHPTEEKRRSVLAPEIFLLHSLTIALKQKEKDYKVLQEKRAILKTFSDTISDGTGNTITPNELLETMHQYRIWLDSNIIYLNNEGNAFDYKFWSSSNDNNNEQPDTETDEIKSLKQLQAMLFVSSDEWQGWVLEAFLSNTPLTLGLLKEQDNKRHELPKDESTLSYGSIDRYWFWKLDYILWEEICHGNMELDLIGMDDEKKKAVVNYKFRRNRSIEHLHPQTDNLPPEDKWNQPIKNDDIEINQSPKDWFGNLALISSAFNSAQGNDSIGVKFARVKDTQIPQKNLESIKLLLMFLIAKGDDKEWTPDVSVKHGKAMYMLLKSYYESISDKK